MAKQEEKSLASIGLPEGIVRSLKRGGIGNISKLLKKSEEELAKIDGIKSGALTRIKKALRRENLPGLKN